MKAKINISKCISCEECTYVCPVDAIRLSHKTGKPYIIQSRCRGCGACIDVCPVGAIKLKGNDVKNYRRKKD